MASARSVADRRSSTSSSVPAGSVRRSPRPRRSAAPRPSAGTARPRYLVDQLEHHNRVEILVNTEVARLSGEESLSSVELVDNRTGEKRRIDARALFVFIGRSVNTRWLESAVRLDEKGYVVTGADAE